jgi:hypothetical protein
MVSYERKLLAFERAGSLSLKLCGRRRGETLMLSVRNSIEHEYEYRRNAYDLSAGLAGRSVC